MLSKFSARPAFLLRECDGFRRLVWVLPAMGPDHLVCELAYSRGLRKRLTSSCAIYKHPSGQRPFGVHLETSPTRGRRRRVSEHRPLTADKKSG